MPMCRPLRQLGRHRVPARGCGEDEQHGGLPGPARAAHHAQTGRPVPVRWAAGQPHGPAGPHA